MIPLSTLLLVAGTATSPALPPLSVDPCVQVDVEEVRRLAEIELSTLHGARSPAELAVSVTCEAGMQQLTLTDRTTDRVTVRSIDLSAPVGTDRDAKERELALAIAELVRRAAAESAPAPPPPPPPRPPPKPVAKRRPSAVEPRTPPFGVELGAAASGVGWTGGEVWLGADVTTRFRLARWLLLELQIGGRKTRAVGLASGTLEGRGLAGRAGLAVDLTPGMRRAGLSLGASLGGDWLSYVAVDRAGREYGGGDGGVASAAGTTTGFATLSGPLCFTLRAAVGGPLHSLRIRDNGRSVSGARGVLVSTAVGLAVHF